MAFRIMHKSTLPIIFIFLHTIFVCSSNCLQPRKPTSIILRSNLPINWLVIDLVYYGYVHINETVLLENSTESNYFHVDNHQLLVRSPLTDVRESEFDLQLVVDSGQFQRAFLISIKLDYRCIFGFNLDVYEAKLKSSAEVDTLIQFPLALALNFNRLKSNGVNIKQKLVRYAIITSTDQLGVTLINRPNKAEIYLSTVVPISIRSPQQFFVGAFDIETQQLLASARCQLWILNDVEPPKFTAHTYSITVNSIAPFSNILRVTAKSANSVVTYQIEPEVSEFDISPFSGDIFTRKYISPGHYTFTVTAKNSNTQKTAVPVKVFVVSQASIPKISKARNFALRTRFKSTEQQRYRRGLATDINLEVPEDQPVGFLKKRVPFNHNERIIKSSDSNGYITVYQNGSIELVRELNYELQKAVTCVVQIINKVKPEDRVHELSAKYGKIF